MKLENQNDFQPPLQFVIEDTLLKISIYVSGGRSVYIYSLYGVLYLFEYSFFHVTILHIKPIISFYPSICHCLLYCTLNYHNSI